MNKPDDIKQEIKQKGKSNCCNSDLIRCFGNVTNVLLGGKVPEPELRCMKCGKVATKNI